MAKYFFSTTQGSYVHNRDEGLEFPNDDAAWEEATSACGEILRHIDGDLKKHGHWHMDVKDENQELIYRITILPEAFQRSS
jgi:hypothetical protein